MGNSHWKRSKGTEKEMRESTSSHLHLTSYERRKITLKLLQWWKKKRRYAWCIPPEVESTVWMTQRQREKGGRMRTFVWENLMGDSGEERECYLTAVNKTAIPLSGDVTGSPLNTVISSVCIKTQQMSSDCELICSINLGIVRLSTINMSISKCDLVSHSPCFSQDKYGIGHENEIASEHPISFSHPYSKRQAALSFFWQSCHSIEPTILVTHKANRNENIVSEKTHGVTEMPGAGWIT